MPRAWSAKSPGGGEILSVTLTREGRLAVTLNERGYKAAVEVYNEDGVKEFAFHSADSFLMTSSVSRDGKEMAAVTMGQSQGSFTSSIVLYKLDRQEAYATCDLAGVAVYDLGLVGKRYCAVAEDSLHFIDQKGRPPRPTAMTAAFCAGAAWAATAMPPCCWAVTRWAASCAW